MAGDTHGIDNQEEAAAQAGGQEGQQAQDVSRQDPADKIGVMISTVSAFRRRPLFLFL